MILQQADLNDIDELIQLRIAYLNDDFGQISEDEKQCITKQLSDYFMRRLGTELIAFIARDNGRIVSVAQLHIIEMPANTTLLSGIRGEVLSVYTLPEYRGRGLCSQLMQNLLAYGKEAGLGRIDLSATEKGYPIYKKLGFKEKSGNYTEMRYQYE